MKKGKIFLVSFFILALMFSFAEFANATGGGKGGGGKGVCGDAICDQGENNQNCPSDCPDCNTCQCQSKGCETCPKCVIPLDGGISVLLMLGLAYGTKKVYDKGKKSVNK